MKGVFGILKAAWNDTTRNDRDKTWGVFAWLF